MPKQTILVADDDQVVTGLLSSFLRTKGFNVVVAYDAMQAWMAALRERPAAILLDIKMPGGTGLDILKRIKASTKTNTIPVISVSSMTDPQTVAQAKSLGAEEFIPKPVDLEKLFGVLQRLLGLSSEPKTTTA